MFKLGDYLSWPFLFNTSILYRLNYLWTSAMVRKTIAPSTLQEYVQNLAKKEKCSFGLIIGQVRINVRNICSPNKSSLNFKNCSLLARRWKGLHSSFCSYIVEYNRTTNKSKYFKSLTDTRIICCWSCHAHNKNASWWVIHSWLILHHRREHFQANQQEVDYNIAACASSAW